MRLTRWTAWLYLFPRRFIENNWKWRTRDLQDWSENKYQWIEDSNGGLKDYVRYPDYAWKVGKGDCEDYATVVASWLLSNGKEATLGFLFTKELPPKGHVVVYSEGKVYSSGNITEESLKEYRDRSKYDLLFTRSV